MRRGLHRFTSLFTSLFLVIGMAAGIFILVSEALYGARASLRGGGRRDTIA